MQRTKVVYRDVESGRLITRFDADRRDPDTWIKEQFTVAPQSSFDGPARDDSPVVSHGTGALARATASDEPARAPDLA